MDRIKDKQKNQWLIDRPHLSPFPSEIMKHLTEKRAKSSEKHIGEDKLTRPSKGSKSML